MIYKYSADIIGRNTIGTVEICIQGGINAANGIRSSFRVYPIQMVVRSSKPKRDDKGSGQQEPRNAKPVSFDAALEKVQTQDCPEECYTVTYDRQSHLQTYYYCQSREYTF